VKHQNLYAERIEAEKEARELKRRGDPHEAAAWDYARRIGDAERAAKREYDELRRIVERGADSAGTMVTAPSGGVLFLRRAKGDHLGEWCFPGGRAEGDESSEEAARRELREETGMDDGRREAMLAHRGEGYDTFSMRADAAFEPKLNDEHDEFRWAALDVPPEPLHPGARETIDALRARASDERIAFDRGSSRSYDADGRLRIADARISKATVNEYLGSEIPRAAELGLDPAKKYRLLRDPEELRKGAESFNGVPLMSSHVYASAAEHPKEAVIGAAGTDARFEPPYLIASLVVWPGDDIGAIERDEKRELSCSYHYDADMTPGAFEGMPYDGVMRNIRGNHVALVRAGRAGRDVAVGDSAPAPRLEIIMGEGNDPLMAEMAAAAGPPRVVTEAEAAAHPAPGAAHRYDREAVNKAIASSNRSGRPIGGKEAAMIHRILKGRGDAADADFDETPGGMTRRTHTSSSHAPAGFRRVRDEAHAHADHLRSIGHEGVKVTKTPMQMLTVPGRGISVTQTFTTHHGFPKDRGDAAGPRDPLASFEVKK
jgi:8-oxo-dGTP pyrophosphatase MutT (NUDIX family)